MRVLVIESKPQFGPKLAKYFSNFGFVDLTENADEKAVIAVPESTIVSMKSVPAHASDIFDFGVSKQEDEHMFKDSGVQCCVLTMAPEALEEEISKLCESIIEMNLKEGEGEEEFEELEEFFEEDEEKK